METEKRTLFFTFGISLLCHLLFFGLMLFWPSSSPALRFQAPSAIQVDMVSLPAPPATGEQPLAQAEPEPEPVEEASPEEEIEPEKPEPEPEPEVAIPEKKEPEVEVKEPEPEKVVKEPPKQLTPKVKPKPDKLPAKLVTLEPRKKKSKPKKKVEPKKEKSSDTIKKAIAKLETSKRKASYDPVKAKIEKFKKRYGDRDNAADASKTQGGGAYASGERGKYSAALAGRLNIYKYGPLMDSINQNWAFNPVLAGGGEDLEVQLLVKIMADGKVGGIKYVKRSGNDLLDESAYRAIKKSDPLPPLPKGLPYYEIIMGFGPSGLN